MLSSKVPGTRYFTKQKFLRGLRGFSARFYKKRHLRCGIKNVSGDDILFETKYAALALQMLPHAVGPGCRRHSIFRMDILNFFVFMSIL
jgi:hypothetical protein